MYDKEAAILKTAIMNELEGEEEKHAQWLK